MVLFERTRWGADVFDGIASRTRRSVRRPQDLQEPGWTCGFLFVDAPVALEPGPLEGGGTSVKARVPGVQGGVVEGSASGSSKSSEQ